MEKMQLRMYDENALVWDGEKHERGAVYEWVNDGNDDDCHWFVTVDENGAMVPVCNQRYDWEHETLSAKEYAEALRMEYEIC